MLESDKHTMKQEENDTLVQSTYDTKIPRYNRNSTKVKANTILMLINFIHLHTDKPSQEKTLRKSRGIADSDQRKSVCLNASNAVSLPVSAATT
jgi:hypothetical protein